MAHQRVILVFFARVLRVALSVALGGGLPATVVQAADLMQVWQAAQQHDADFLAAQAAYEAGATQREQASALWRPTVQASGTAGRMTNETQTQGAQFYAPGFALANGAAFNTSIVNGNMDRWAISARQPIVSGERLAQTRQLDLKAQIAELEWKNARQELMLRTAQRYFDVAVAQESLSVTRRQEVAVEKALGEVQSRYKLGDVPITDTDEVLARVEVIRAQIVATETELQLKQAALADATNLPSASLDALEPTHGGITASGEPLEQWVADAVAGNPGLRMRELQVDVARRESDRYDLLSASSVDLVGEVTHDHLSGSGDYGAASNTLRTGLVGVQLTVPLYTGGYRSARRDEAQHLADKALNETERTRQQVSLQTRAAWLGLTAGSRREQALAAGLKASEARLAATRLGHRVGDRSTLDLLSAENDAASARLSWLQARVALVMNRLQLEALAGKLDESQLQAANALLETPTSSSAHPVLQR